MHTIIRIGLADDHLLMRKGLTMLINGFDNIQVITDTENGRELLDKIHTLNEPPDICILDVRMPVLNGFETLLQLKQQWPHVKALMLSMYDNELSIIKFMRNGADGYIVKDCDPKELEKAILRVYSCGIYYPEALLNQIPRVNDKNINNIFPELSAKEYTFLSYCGTELTLKEIADRMNQSLRTIEGYRDHLLKKLNVKSRIGLAVFAIEAGITCIVKTE